MIFKGAVGEILQKCVDILEKETREGTELEKKYIRERNIWFPFTMEKEKGRGTELKKYIDVGRTCLFSLCNGNLLLNTPHKIRVSS